VVLILISTDVLREIRRDIAENLRKRDLPVAEENQVAQIGGGRVAIPALEGSTGLPVLKADPNAAYFALNGS
jgi:NADPH-dependent glutamate synthase beta subunit-like oxidoreductase